jgi:hypothetical protein
MGIMRAEISNPSEREIVHVHTNTLDTDVFIADAGVRQMAPKQAYAGDVSTSSYRHPKKQDVQQEPNQGI